MASKKYANAQFQLQTLPGLNEDGWWECEAYLDWGGEGELFLRVPNETSRYGVQKHISIAYCPEEWVGKIILQFSGHAPQELVMRGRRRLRGPRVISVPVARPD